MRLGNNLNTANSSAHEDLSLNNMIRSFLARASFGFKSKESVFVISPPQTASVCVLAAEMTSKMVIKQPQPVLESKESDEWHSGICDCCENKAECM